MVMNQLLTLLSAMGHGRLFGMDVNDNYRSWDDDLIAVYTR